MHKICNKSVKSGNAWNSQRMNRARREIPTWVQFASQTEPKQELQAPADLIQFEPNLT